MPWKTWRTSMQPCRACRVHGPHPTVAPGLLGCCRGYATACLLYTVWQSLALHHVDTPDACHA